MTSSTRASPCNFESCLTIACRAAGPGATKGTVSPEDKRLAKAGNKLGISAGDWRDVIRTRFTISPKRSMIKQSSCCAAGLLASSSRPSITRQSTSPCRRRKSATVFVSTAAGVGAGEIRAARSLQRGIRMGVFPTGGESGRQVRFAGGGGTKKDDRKKVGGMVFQEGVGGDSHERITVVADELIDANNGTVVAGGGA